ncbi:DoxX family protein [Rhodococcus kronopolitis]|uniref:DoxX family protein n=1 Tax=Rhodococcus kronopolitis TaxID=1460226 RepID=A0ABV9FM29_9NOCA
MTPDPRDVSSPFDHPTEWIPTTDDDLGLLPTEQIPTYGGPALPARDFSSPTRVTEVLPTLDSFDGADSYDGAASFANTGEFDTDSFDGVGNFELGDPIEVQPQVVAPSPARLVTTADTATPAVVSAPRGTLDLGLLVLRVAVGALALGHGLQKLFGWWGGPGLDGFETVLVDAGFDYARPLAILGAVAEVAGGAFLIVGLLTPLAAASVLVVLINAWCVRQVAEPGLQFFAPAGVEYETLLAAALVAVILCGPGRISLDSTRRWATRPRTGSALALVLGIGVGVAVWVYLDGANPLI